MKKFFCLVFFLFVTTASAWGVTVEFDRFTADVPDGWFWKTEGAIVSLHAPEKHGTILVKVDKMNGRSLKDIATEMASKTNSTPTALPNDAGFTYSFKNRHNVDLKCIIRAHGTDYTWIIAGGKSPQVPQVLDSIKEK